MKRWQFWLGTLISIACIYLLVLTWLNFTQLWDSLRSENYLWLLPGIGVKYWS